VARLRSTKSQEKACAGKFYQERCIQLRWLASCNCQSSLKGEDDRMSIFPTKILFATDGSRDAEVAATAAVGLARATSSELHVVTAAERSTLIMKLTGRWPSARGNSPKRFSTSS
jgi:hypothetical protein